MTGAPCCPERAGDRGRPYTYHYFAWHEDDGSIDLARTAQLGGLPASDLDCARLIQRMTADAWAGMFHARQTGRWHYWDGSGVYAGQDTEFCNRMIQWAAEAHYDVARRVAELEGSLTAQLPPNERKAAEDRAKARWGRHHSFCNRLWTDAGQAALDRQLSRICGMDAERLDTGTGEVVVDNGVISYEQVLADCRVVPLPHDRRRMETRRLGKGVRYDPDAPCPWFEQMMRTSVPDEGQRHWLLWRTANALFGRIPEKGFLNLIGERDSGKSTFTEIIKLLASGYARKVPASTFLAKHAGDSGFKEADLRGGRFVYTHEPQKGSRFDEELLKTLTGRDEQRTAGKYEKPLSWEPQLTIFIGTNSPIRFASSDEAFMDRVEVIRFCRTGPRDEHLMEKLKGELTGIFALLMKYVAWEALAGPPPFPQSSIDEREKMVSQTETPLAFITEWIEQGLLVVKHDVPAYRCVKVGYLYTQYSLWCAESGEHKMGRQSFTAVVSRRYPKSQSGGYYHFSGLLPVS